MMSDLVSDLVSVRVPTCPLERAKLAMSDTFFHDNQVREVLGSSDPELSTVHCAQCQVLSRRVILPGQHKFQAGGSGQQVEGR
jgi:hypothetical protein